MNDRADVIRGKLLLLREFLASDTYRMLDEMMVEQVNLRRQRILLTPLASADSIYEQEFSKGEAAGIELSRGLPAVVLETLQQDYEKELQNGNRNEQQSDE